MLVYQDLFTEDEMMSDSYRRNPIEVDGEVIEGLFEVESENRAVGADDVDIGCGNEFGGGDDAMDDSVETENTVSGTRTGFNYTEMPFSSKAELKEYLKDYMRRIRAHMKESGAERETIKQFMEESGKAAIWLINKYRDLQFFMGPSMDPDAGIVYAYYKDGAITPTFVYFKWGLRECKF